MKNTLEASILNYDSVLRLFAARFTQSKAEIDDLIQETYYRALLNRDRFAEGTNLKAWLYTILRNIFINNYKRRNHTRFISQLPDEQSAGAVTPPVEKNKSYQMFLAEDIDRAMKNTGSDFVNAFLMHHNGFKYEEIADTLSLPLGTVKSRIFSARKELQQQLKEMGIENASYN